MYLENNGQWTISSEKKYLKWLSGETKFKDLEIFISFDSIQHISQLMIA